MYDSVDIGVTSSRGLRWSRWCRSVTPIALSVSVLASMAALGPVGAQDMSSDSQATIHYKGLTITPGGYFAAEALYREKSEEADIGSSFNAIPFPGTTSAALSEFRGSARQSRLALGVAGKAGTTNLSGYWESDFLSAGVTSNSNESNSYTLRLRQFWGQANWSDGSGFMAGNGWSTLTTEKKGVAPRQEFIPQTIDAQYVAGFDWARQWQLRAWKGFDNKVWLVGSVEGAAATLTAHGAANNFVVGQAGGQLLNSTANYSTDLSPDVVGKLVFEPGFGHYEIKAIGRAFRDRIIDPADAVGGTRNHTEFGGGVGFGAVWPVNVPTEGGKTRDAADIGLSGLWGAGIGRYGTSSLSDVTARPNGALSPIRAAHALFSVELHPIRKLDIYGYGGAEYAYRDAFLKGAAGEGYGSPLLSNAGCTQELAPTGPFAPTSGTCNADTRALWQGAGGFWYRFYQGPSGSFQWGIQYSYTSRNTWSGAAGLQPQAIDQMVFTSFRYIIP
jgi:hypothetical protein